MDILVGVDRSPESKNAFVSAMDIVAAVGGRIIAVHVTSEDESTAMDAAIAELDSRAGDRGVDLESILVTGDPVEELPRIAAEHEVDAIYLGHRGLSSEGEEFPGERRGRLGSVARGVMQRSRIPVTVFDRGL